METIAITAQKREHGSKGKLASLRREGFVPGILYGNKGLPEMLAVRATDLRPALARRNPILEITLDGKSHKAMLKLVERDPIREDLIHIDFLRVDDMTPVTAVVQVITQGIPVGVRLDGGVFRMARKNVQVKCKIQDIPENFTIDVSNMKQGENFFVKDLKFGKGTFVTPARTALFGVGQAHVEEEVAVIAAPVAAAPAAGAPGAPGVAPSADKATAPGAAPAGKDKAAPAAGGKGGGKPSK